MRVSGYLKSTSAPSEAKVRPLVRRLTLSPGDIESGWAHCAKCYGKYDVGLNLRICRNQIKIVWGLVSIFHIYIHRYLNKRRKEALTSMKQLFNFTHVDG
jgi:hypothetical protein